MRSTYSPSFQNTQSSYILYKNKYQPINNTPSNGLKCTSCTQMVSPGELQSHLQSHLIKKHCNKLDRIININCSQKSNNNKLNRMKVSQKISQCLETQDNQTIPTVKSLFPDQLPKNQFQRRKKIDVQNSIQNQNQYQYQNSNNQNNNLQILNKQIKLKKDYKENITSRLGICGNNKNQDIQMINLQQSLIVPIHKIKVPNKKNINIYQHKRENQQKEKNCFKQDNQIKKSKKGLQRSKLFLRNQSQIVYEMVQSNNQSQNNSLKTNVSNINCLQKNQNNFKRRNQDKNRGIVQINFKKFPGNNVNAKNVLTSRTFNSRSKSKQRQNKGNSHFLNSVQTEDNQNGVDLGVYHGQYHQFSFFQQNCVKMGNIKLNNKSNNYQKVNQNPNQSHSHHNNQCPNCHGFYCPTCHSTIPPQFRPVNPLSSSKNSQQIQNFWKKMSMNNNINSNPNQSNALYLSSCNSSCKCNNDSKNSKSSKNQNPPNQTHNSSKISSSQLVKKQCKNTSSSQKSNSLFTDNNQKNQNYQTLLSNYTDNKILKKDKGTGCFHQNQMIISDASMSKNMSTGDYFNISR